MQPEDGRDGVRPCDSGSFLAKGYPRTTCKDEAQAGPGGERTAVPGTHETESEYHLAARRTWEELAQPHNIGIRCFVKPAAAYDELATEIPDVGDGSPEARNSELTERHQHLERGARESIRRRGRVDRGRHGWCLIQAA